MRHTFLKICLLVSLLITLVVYDTSAMTSPLPRKSGGAVCLVMDSDPGADPLAANSPVDLDIARACYITLFQLGPDGMPQPYLCEDFSLNWFDSELAVLIRSAGFSNGSKITAADCKFTIERALRNRPDLVAGFTSIIGSGDFLSGAADGISGIIVRSENELAFSLIAPARALDLIGVLANPALGIISKARYEQSSVGYFDAPVTSGPFEYTKSREGVILSPQTNFPFGQPWLDSILLKPGIGESAHLEFSTAAAGLIEAPPAYYYQYKNDLNLQHRSAESGVMLEYALLLDPSSAPLNEGVVRTAIRMAIDHRGLVDVTLGGAAMDVFIPLQGTADEDYRSIVEKASATLEGFGDLGLYSIGLGYPKGDIRAELMAQKIAQNLNALGLRVNATPVADFGESGIEVNTSMMLMPFPLSTGSEKKPGTVLGLAVEWGFGGGDLVAKAGNGHTAGDCYLPLLRPERLVVTGDDYINPEFGMWGEIDFYRLSLK